MKSRALRLTLLALFVGLLVGAAYIVWNEESQGRATSAAGHAFDDRVRAFSRVLLDVKSAQPGYVAAGQGEDFWISRVSGLLESAREAWPVLRSQAQTAQAHGELETAAAAFEDFTQMDRRARDYARNGQRLLASDLVFSDGIEKIDAVLAALDRARTSELAARAAAVQLRRRSQLLAVAGAAALGLFVVFVLAPLPRTETPEPVEVPQEVKRERDAPAGSVTLQRSVPAPSAPSAPLDPVGAAAVAPSVEPPAAVSPSPPVAPPAPAVDLHGIAALCTDLSRVFDTRALPAALERAAALLDASVIVVWIADPDGRELAPVIAHGYPQNLLARLGTIPRETENVTAAAFRTGLVQTVKSDAVSHGAIAAPLLTPTGPVGVMAAEVLHEGERREATRAVAAIVAAQLAFLMGPTSRTAEKTGA